MTKKSRDRRKKWRFLKRVSRHVGLNICWLKGDNIGISINCPGGII